MTVIIFLLSVVIAYLMGSICSAVIVSKMFDLPDPRQEGSKNPGATNVLRLAGKKYAAIVMVVDVLKGLIPVLLAKLLGASVAIQAFAALAAVLGHMFPVFFEFKGGKGVATALGAYLGFHVFLGLLVAVTWLAVARFSRYSSLASLISMILAPIYALIFTADLAIFPPLFFIAIFILYKHADNITRLMDGEEPKIDFNKANNAQEAANDLVNAEYQPETESTPKASEKKTTKKAAKPKADNDKKTTKSTTKKKTKPVAEEK